MRNLAWAFMIVLSIIGGADIVWTMIEKSSHPKPGNAPTDVFHDDGEWYSQDGCWHLRDGYWRPLRRCNIVRVPAP